MQYSIELSPPRTPKDYATFCSALELAKKQGIEFVSLVHFSQLDLELQKNILKQSIIPLCPHITCHFLQEHKLQTLLHLYQTHNVKHLLAIRGDHPPPNASYQTSESLIASIDKTRFWIFGGAYPEKYLIEDAFQKEIETLQQKAQKGASGFITQFFFDADLFLKYREKASKNGADLSFRPGILATKDLKKAIEISQLCGVTPPDLKEKTLESHIRSLCKKLKQEGVTQFHFFTLNNPDFSYQLIQELGCK